jgi:hypothetical protein
MSTPQNTNPYAAPQTTASFPTNTISKGRLIAGYVLSVLPALMLLMGAYFNISQPDEIVKQTIEMGYTQEVMLPLGIVCIVIAVLLIIPRTALIGALLLTAYLGGAVATHVIHRDDLVKILIPVIFASVVWIGLILRNPKLNKLMPWGEGL